LKYVGQNLTDYVKEDGIYKSHLRDISLVELQEPHIVKESMDVWHFAKLVCLWLKLPNLLKVVVLYL
jgi:hypothetical protein